MVDRADVSGWRLNPVSLYAAEVLALLDRMAVEIPTTKALLRNGSVRNLRAALAAEDFSTRTGWRAPAGDLGSLPGEGPMVSKPKQVARDAIVERGTANSHVFSDQIKVGGECVAFANEPWSSRIATALSPQGLDAKERGE